MKALGVILCLFAVGCHQRGTIKTPMASVIGVKDAGNPATIDSRDKGEALPIPAGSKLTVTKTEAREASPAYKDIPAREAEPAKEVTEIVLSKDTVWQKKEVQVSANTGTVDTSIRKHEIDVKSSYPLLIAFILSIGGAAFFTYKAYPTPAIICGGCAGIFILAWKATGLPAWFWVVGAFGIAAAFFLYLGHKRGEKDATTHA